MKLSKTIAALAAAGALLVMATPASAVTVNLTVTSGTLATTVGTFDLSGGGTPVPPCTNLSTDVDTITIEDSSTGTTVVTAVNITTSMTSGTPTGPYEILITLRTTGNNTGTAQSTSPFAVATNLSLLVQIREGCTSTGTLVCTVQVNFNTTAPATQLTGNATGHHMTSTDWVTLGGTGRVTSVFPLACNAPFSSLLNSNATVTSLRLDA